jgi:hypothetical protein
MLMTPACLSAKKGCAALFSALSSPLLRFSLRSPPCKTKKFDPVSQPDNLPLFMKCSLGWVELGCDINGIVSGGVSAKFQSLGWVELGCDPVLAVPKIILYFAIFCPLGS